MPHRVKYLRHLLNEYRPKTVVCYGKGCWQKYQELFDKDRFSQHGPFMVAQHQDTCVILTKHLMPRVMKNEELDDVVALIKNGG